LQDSENESSGPVPGLILTVVPPHRRPIDTQNEVFGASGGRLLLTSSCKFLDCFLPLLDEGLEGRSMEDPMFDSHPDLLGEVLAEWRR